MTKNTSPLSVPVLLMLSTHRIISQLLVAFALLPLPLAAQYDSTALRSNLSFLPYFDTAGGREKHRFTDAPVNAYRI